MSEIWDELIKGKKPCEQLAAGWLCPFCGLRRESDHGPDPCFGELPGVEFACCGHGGLADSLSGYIKFTNGKVLRFGFAGTVDGVTR